MFSAPVMDGSNQGFLKRAAAEYRKRNKIILKILQNGYPRKDNRALDLVTEQKAPPVSTYKTTNFLFKVAFLIGLTMPQGCWLVKIAYALYAFVAIMLGTVYLPIAFVLSYVTMSAAEFEIGNLLTSLQVTFDVFSGSTKFFILAGFLVKLRSTRTIIDELDKRCHEADEIAEMHAIVRFGRKCVIFFAFVYLNYSSSTFLGAIVMEHPPYSLYFPFLKWRRSHVEFLMASVLEYIMMNYAVLQQIFNDAYGVIYVSILRAHMKILLLRVQKLSTNPALSQEQNYNELKACIKDHQKLLNLFDIISPIISMTVFVQFMITAAILGTTLINIMIFATEFSSRVASCCYVLAVTTEIFPICFYSQCLMDDSNRLANVIFHSNWSGQNSRYKQLLIFFMQRAQNPMELTAGKLFPITLGSFVSIAKFSFSLYTFIKKMNLKERLGLE